MFEQKDKYEKPVSDPLDLLNDYPDCHVSLVAFLQQFVPKDYSIEDLFAFAKQMEIKEKYVDDWLGNSVGYDHISSLYFKAVRFRSWDDPGQVYLVEQMISDAPDSPLTHDIVLTMCEKLPKEKICQNLEGMGQYIADALMKVRLAILPTTDEDKKNDLFTQTLIDDYASFNSQLFVAYDKALFNSSHQRSAVGLMHIVGILAARSLPGATGIQEFCKTSHELCYQVGQKIASRHDMDSGIYGAILSKEAVSKLDEKAQLEHKAKRKAFYDQELKTSNKAFEKFMHLAMSMQDPEISDGDFEVFIEDMNSVGYSEAYNNLMGTLYEKNRESLISKDMLNQVSRAFDGVHF